MILLTWHSASGRRTRGIVRRVVAIGRARKETGDSVRKIAARFGVDPSTVQRICRPLDGTGVVQILIHIPIVHDSEIPLKPSKHSTMVPKQTTVADIRAARRFAERPDADRV